MKLLEAPLVSYLAIGFFSLLAAWVMFLIGGSLATVSNQEGKLLGIGFEAGGAFAGFIIVFLLSQRTVERLRTGQTSSQSLTLRVPVNDQLPLEQHSSVFTQGQSYVCKYWLLNPQTDEEREFDGTYTWEAGHLTVYVREVGEHDLVKIRVEYQGEIWESENFPGRTLPARVTAV